MSLFARPPRVERRVVKPGQCVAMFEIGKDGLLDRQLVDAKGRPCNSLGLPLPTAGKRKAKRAAASKEKEAQ